MGLQISENVGGVVTFTALQLPLVSPVPFLATVNRGDVCSQIFLTLCGKPTFIAVNTFPFYFIFFLFNSDSLLWFHILTFLMRFPLLTLAPVNLGNSCRAIPVVAPAVFLYLGLAFRLRLNPVLPGTDLLCLADKSEE